MFKYENCTCPYCGEPLLPTDELAVCPECGTPHHRACYKDHGQCANQAAHADGFEWTPPAAAQPVAPAPHIDSVACLNCGAINPMYTSYCNQCGAPMSYVQQPAPFAPQEVVKQDPSMMPFALEESIRSDEKLDGFSVRDWIAFIASNVGYYLYCFKMQDNSGRKFSFTWSAMLFPSAYFLYRKVWGAAIAAFGTSVLMGIPAIFVQYLVPLGIDLGLSATTWTSAANILSILMLTVNFFWGLSAVHLYRRSAVRKMTALQKNCGSAQEFSARVRTIGGTSWPAILLIFAASFVLTLPLALVIGLAL